MLFVKHIGVSHLILSVDRHTCMELFLFLGTAVYLPCTLYIPTFVHTHTQTPFIYALLYSSTVCSELEVLWDFIMVFIQFLFIYSIIDVTFPILINSSDELLSIATAGHCAKYQDHNCDHDRPSPCPLEYLGWLLLFAVISWLDI